MALDGPFVVGLRHHVCSPARSRLDLARWPSLVVMVFRARELLVSCSVSLCVVLITSSSKCELDVLSRFPGFHSETCRHRRHGACPEWCVCRGWFCEPDFEGHVRSPGVPT